jgi:hypothetical protein
MNYAHLPAAGVIALLCLSGCNSAQSPQTVANDTAAAAQKADTKVTDAQNDASKDNAKMQSKIDEKTAALNDTEAKGAYDVAIKQADGTHTVALEQCKALAGDAQKGCKSQADADYDAAKTNAKAAEVARTR